MRITVGNIKGGVAKTTTSIYLALALARQGRKVLLVDADPEQASALSWSETATNEWPENCSVIAISTRDLGKRATSLAEGFDDLVIDTSPKNPLLLRQALSITDDLIIPVAPRPMEIREVQATLLVAEEVGIIHDITPSVLLVQVRKGTLAGNEIRGFLQEMDMPLLQSQVHMRESYSRSYGSIPEFTKEYDDVLQEITINNIARIQK